MQENSSVTFGAGLLDRAAHCRADAVARWHTDAARTVVFWRGKPLVDDEGTLSLLPTQSSNLSGLGADAVYLGQSLGPPDEGVDVFAVDVSDHWDVQENDASQGGLFDNTQHKAPFGVGAFVDLRAVMVELSPWEAEVAATAQALTSWHARHGYCANCGGATANAEAGWRRDCDACSAQHFPRTDPVVIMLVTHGNSVLVGRDANWPEGMYSLLAGFVEPGEPLEAAVRREVFEETGVKVGDVSYVASQPWPFPANLMLGCTARALSTKITLDLNELEDALWVSREEMARIQAGVHARIKPARKGAIAHFLILKWLADKI